jgi:2-dehydro-3-deoxyglucarate aldolase/4-hydroxy-2-oxoheptanedioate aldolase
MRELCGTNALKIGSLVFELATPGIGYILEAAGADFMVLDLEHSGFGYETAKSVVAYARAAALPIAIRVPSTDAKDLARAADVGADAVMVPNVADEAAARRIVHALKYAPVGLRGVYLNNMHDRYRPGSLAEKAPTANAHLAVLAQIESASGVADAEKIAAIDGIDCLWLGHMDLSCSLGTPGRFDTPTFADALRRVVDAARGRGKSAARLVQSAEEGAEAHRQGFDMLSLSNDVAVLRAAWSGGIAALRTATRAPP